MLATVLVRSSLASTLHLPLSMEIRIVAFLTHHSAETVIATFMRGIVTCFADNHAVVPGSLASSFDVNHVMRSRAFAIPVLGTLRVTKARDPCPTARAQEPLTSES